MRQTDVMATLEKNFFFFKKKMIGKEIKLVSHVHAHAHAHALH